MDKKVLVDSIHNVIDIFTHQNGAFSLVMLLPDSEGTLLDKFTLVISAPWLNFKSQKESISSFFDALIDEMGGNSPELAKISRINIIKTYDPFVQNITSAYNVSGRSDVTIQGCIINTDLYKKS